MDGVTAHRYGGQILYRNFNPRAPCGARHEAYRMGFIDGLISIHAPRAGRGNIHLTLDVAVRSFNPRAPCGARRKHMMICRLPFPFQSTRPVRGAAGLDCLKYINNGISIHAPRAGRGAFLQSKGIDPEGISIHAPVRGAAARPFKIDIIQRISIHAPVRGAALPRASTDISTENFNPRARAGRGLKNFALQLVARISIHAPVRGAALHIKKGWTAQGRFQSTRPCGARP